MQKGLIYLLVLFLMSSFALAISPANISFYAMNSTEVDEWGGYNGMLVNNAVYTTRYPTFGTSGNGVNASIYFDGVGDYFNVTTTPEVFKFKNNFSISFWFNTSSVVAGTFVASTYDPNGAQGSGWRITTYNGTAHYGIGFEKWTSASAHEELYINGFHDGSWHHVVVVQDYLRGIEIWVDGVKQGSKVSNVTDVYYDATTPYLMFGATNNDGSISVDILSDMDHIKIFNESSTSANISDLYEYGETMGSATPLMCGDQIITDTNLTANLTGGSTSVDCLTINASNLYLDCKGFTITGSMDDAILLPIKNISNVTIRNCNLHPTATSSSGDGIVIGSSSKNISVLNNTINWKYSSTWYISSIKTGNAINTRDITINDNVINASSCTLYQQSAIMASDTIGAKIFNNTIYTNGTRKCTGVMLDSNFYSVMDVNITKNNISDMYLIIYNADNVTGFTNISYNILKDSDMLYYFEPSSPGEQYVDFFYNNITNINRGIYNINLKLIDFIGNNISFNHSYASTAYGFNYEGFASSRIRNNYFYNVPNSSLLYYDSTVFYSLGQFYNNYMNNSNSFLLNDTAINLYLNHTQLSATNIMGGPYIGGNYWKSYTNSSDTTGNGFLDNPFHTAGFIDYLPLSNTTASLSSVRIFPLAYQDTNTDLTCNFSASILVGDTIDTVFYKWFNDTAMLASTSPVLDSVNFTDGENMTCSVYFNTTSGYEAGYQNSSEEFIGLECGDNLFKDFSGFRNVSCTGQTAVNITNSSIIFDCNGFELSSSGFEIIRILNISANNTIIKDCKFNGSTTAINLTDLGTSIDIFNFTIFNNSFTYSRYGFFTPISDSGGGSSSSITDMLLSTNSFFNVSYPLYATGFTDLGRTPIVQNVTIVNNTMNISNISIAICGFSNILLSNNSLYNSTYLISFNTETCQASTSGFIYNNYFDTTIGSFSGLQYSPSYYNKTINFKNNIVSGNTTCTGNFYSSFIGNDTNGNDVVDTNYTLSEAYGIIDWCPLINNFSATYTVALDPLPVELGIDLNCTYAITNNRTAQDIGYKWIINGTNSSITTKTLGSGNFTNNFNVSCGVIINSSHLPPNEGIWTYSPTATVNDTTVPLVSNWSLSSASIYQFNPTSIYVDVYSKIGMDYVRMQINPVSGNALGLAPWNETMSLGSGIQYLKFKTFTVTGTYNFTFFARNGNGYETVNYTNLLLSVTTAPESSGGGGGGGTIIISDKGNFTVEALGGLTEWKDIVLKGVPSCFDLFVTNIDEEDQSFVVSCNSDDNLCDYTTIGSESLSLKPKEKESISICTTVPGDLRSLDKDQLKFNIVVTNQDSIKLTFPGTLIFQKYGSWVAVMLNWGVNMFWAKESIIEWLAWFFAGVLSLVLVISASYWLFYIGVGVLINKRRRVKSELKFLRALSIIIGILAHIQLFGRL